MTATPTSMAPQGRPPTAQVVVVLSLLLGLQPVTTDLYLPSLPGLARELGAPMAGAQLTLSALILAFGLGQLVVGPMSDRFGRRPLLLGGLSVYVMASMASL
jgi:DHA1 family bicyclomycin/chloramphenicol resistance-like MFS transporter